MVSLHRTPQALALAFILSATFSPLANAYISSGLPPHVHRAWLERMTFDVCQSPLGDLSPEMLETAPQLLSAWAQNPYGYPSQRKSKSHGKECALEVERLLKRLVDERRAGNKHAISNTAMYNFALAGWAHSGEKGAGAQRAEQILIEMQDSYRRGDYNVQPDTESFKHVLQAWTNSREKYAPQRAQKVLEWMVNLYQSGENDLAMPDEECFAMIMNCYARSGQIVAARKTEKLLLWMERLHKSDEHSLQHLQPRTEHYNAVVRAWSHSDEVIAIQRACEILDHMEALSAARIYHEDFYPNLVTHTTVIRACGRDGGNRANAIAADKVLRKLEKRYLSSGKADAAPDTLIYNLAMDAWTKSDDDAAPFRARKILERQLNMSGSKGGLANATPDVFSYTSVISAAASTKKNAMKTEAFKIAMWTFQSMCKSKVAQPNDVSYGVMLKACARLVPNKYRRERLATKTFTKCRENGFVSPLVINWLRNAVSKELFDELMEGNDPDNFPSGWCESIRKENRSKRMQSKRQQ